MSQQAMKRSTIEAIIIAMDIELFFCYSTSFDYCEYRSKKGDRDELILQVQSLIPAQN